MRDLWRNITLILFVSLKRNMTSWVLFRVSKVNAKSVMSPMMRVLSKKLKLPFIATNGSAVIFNGKGSTLSVQIRSQETRITEICSRIYIMDKTRGATLIIILKKIMTNWTGGCGREERKHNLQDVAGRSKQHSSSTGRMKKKRRNEWELVRSADAVYDFRVFPDLKQLQAPE